MTAVVRKVDELLVRDAGIVDDVRVWLDDATRNPAQQTLGQIDRVIPLLRHVAQHANRFPRDFRSYAVSRQDQYVKVHSTPTLLESFWVKSLVISLQIL